MRSSTLLASLLLLVCVTILLDNYGNSARNDPLSQSRPAGLGGQSERLIQQTVQQQQKDNKKLREVLKEQRKPFDADLDKLFWFVPVKVTDCRDLFRNVKPEHRVQTVFPEHYQTLFRRFEHYLRGMLNNLRIAGTEGNSGDLQEQALAYYHLANATFVKTVCETGFNAGHSTFTWLAANPHLHVYSFDLGEHAYSRPMASYLRDVFKKRLTVYWGDSKLSVPSFSQSHPDVLCDIIVVDGGHTFNDAHTDLKNLRRHANPKHHLLIIDDHPTKVLPGVRQAWEKAVRRRDIEEYFSCTFYPGGWRGFTVGRYTNLDDALML